ncbi:hypothetical protein PR202_gb27164 [Eleusine coracana subsp. coracana]|uniref:GDT1 family protein n=1 Tax=Eleusine coracana subsp. coracana TaxID=191504 RepID=A0AAV5FTJ2_ELECO|nr:hypothetical protein PR202_gb27164 [Eleusine coracana subsp. coracana]
MQCGDMGHPALRFNNAGRGGAGEDEHHRSSSGVLHFCYKRENPYNGPGRGSVPAQNKSAHPGPFASAWNSIHAQRPRGNGRPAQSLPPRNHRHRGAMASVASCSTLFASSSPSSTPFRSRTFRPSLRTLPRRRRLSLHSLSALRCLASGKPPPPPIGGGTGLSVWKAAEPVDGPGAFRAAPFDASCGLAFATVAGMLMLQGSQQALAATQFAGFQPADVLGELGDISSGFASAFLLIFFSELGDRTFFIAALLAARSSGGIIFLGTFGALAVMTVISVVLGRAFHYVDGIIPFSLGGTDFPIDDVAAAGLLVYYGVTTLLDAASGNDEKINEEQEEAELAVSKFSGNGAGVMSAASTIASTFVLVFVAEWGDKSFFSTIALAAASSPLGVIAGSLAGHALATVVRQVVTVIVET